MSNATYLLQVRTTQEVRAQLDKLRQAAGSPMPSQAEIVRQVIKEAFDKINPQCQELP